MPDYRRVRIAGARVFFTVALQDRTSAMLVERVDLLRSVVAAAKVRRPFRIDAWVVLPEHIPCVWTLPEGDADYSGRWQDIKASFSRQITKSEARDTVRRRKGERGIWQRRFWEHTIRNETDFQRHIDYVHLNPLKHGLVERLKDWPYSSFHRYVAAGIYPIDWMTG